MAATIAQTRVYNMTRTICLGMGIPQVVLAHKRLKGTISAASPTGNTVYTGPGPITSFTSQFATQTNVWWVQMPFLRGEQREEDNEFGIQSDQQLMSQIPGVDDSGNLIAIEVDDFIIDAQPGNNQAFWRIVNPVWAPDYSYITFMAERQR